MQNLASMPEGTLKQYWPKLTQMVVFIFNQDSQAAMQQASSAEEPPEDSAPGLLSAETYLLFLQFQDSQAKEHRAARSGATAETIAGIQCHALSSAILVARLSRTDRHHATLSSLAV